MKNRIVKLLVALTLLAGLRQAIAQGTAFTYQGQLDANGAPVNGSYDLIFTLYTNGSGGAAMGGPRTNLATSVSNGLFTATIDFGSDAFTGSSNWLEIDVRTNGNGTFLSLAPRQQITPTPYAMYAPNAGLASTAGSANSVAASNVSGALGLPQLPAVLLTNGQTGVNISGTFSGDGTSLTNVPTSSIAGSLSNVASQSMQRQLAAFVNGMQQLGFWSNIIESAWFAPGQNTGTTNLIGLNTTSGIAPYCIQTNTGLYLNGSNALIIFSNIPPQVGPITLFIFGIGEGWNQTPYAVPGGLFSLSGYDTGEFVLLTMPALGRLVTSPLTALMQMALMMPPTIQMLRSLPARRMFSPAVLS
jgi:hypothetical protein